MVHRVAAGAERQPSLGQDARDERQRQEAVNDVLVTEAWTPLEPNVIELKYHARGVGIIAERQIFGGKDVVELIKVTPGR